MWALAPEGRLIRLIDAALVNEETGPNMATIKDDGRKRVVIEGISPLVDGGRFPAKRILGDWVRVEADIFTDGHDSIAASLFVHHPGSELSTEMPMQPLGNDRWAGSFQVTQLGHYGFRLQGWVDHFATWRGDLLKRIAAETDTFIDYRIGADLIEAAAARASGSDAAFLREQVDLLRSPADKPDLRSFAIDESLHEMMLRYPDKRFATESGANATIVVDPDHARFSAWYEFFPRSTSAQPGEHGTFADCEARLPYISKMGFNVVYLPPIHPIGRTFRKGRNNNPQAQPGEPGSPWAIGSGAGGHKVIHSELGTLDDFHSFVKKAKSLDLLVALDIAFQVAPEHPYVSDHENWFRKRPDGTIQYAENPPKKYQDIYPFDFESQDWEALWHELKDVFVYWIRQGVTIFRVDNPHTKAFAFWEWAIAEIKRDHPEVLFLAEAFTRPKIMYRLAKLGFSQSYTYFPWRIGKAELASYLTELTQPPVREFFRPSQWTNTPDILIEFLQVGGRPAFAIRLLLAATLGANYGIYGPAFELLENRPLRPGSEEYLDSEKYQIRTWDLDRADSLRDFIAAVNAIRIGNQALHGDWSLRFHFTDNEQLLCYSKQSEDRANLIVVVVNLDPHFTQSGFVTLPLEQLEISPDAPYEVEDLLTASRYIWNGPRNYVELNPATLPGHILRIERKISAEPTLESAL